jgi:hypothetical protein
MRKSFLQKALHQANTKKRLAKKMKILSDDERALFIETQNKLKSTFTKIIHNPPRENIIKGCADILNNYQSGLRALMIENIGIIQGYLAEELEKELKDSFRSSLLPLFEQLTGVPYNSSNTFHNNLGRWLRGEIVHEDRDTFINKFLNECIYGFYIKGGSSMRYFYTSFNPYLTPEQISSFLGDQSDFDSNVVINPNLPDNLYNFLFDKIQIFTRERFKSIKPDIVILSGITSDYLLTKLIGDNEQNFKDIFTRMTRQVPPPNIVEVFRDTFSQKSLNVITQVSNTVIDDSVKPIGGFLLYRIELEGGEFRIGEGYMRVSGELVDISVIRKNFTEKKNEVIVPIWKNVENEKAWKNWLSAIRSGIDTKDFLRKNYNNPSYPDFNVPLLQIYGAIEDLELTIKETEARGDTSKLGKRKNRLSAMIEILCSLGNKFSMSSMNTDLEKVQEVCSGKLKYISNDTLEVFVKKYLQIPGEFINKTISGIDEYNKNPINTIKIPSFSLNNYPILSCVAIAFNNLKKAGFIHGLSYTFDGVQYNFPVNIDEYYNNYLSTYNPAQHSNLQQTSPNINMIINDYIQLRYGRTFNDQYMFTVVDFVFVLMLNTCRSLLSWDPTYAFLKAIVYFFVTRNKFYMRPFINTYGMEILGLLSQEYNIYPVTLIGGGAYEHWMSGHLNGTNDLDTEVYIPTAKLINQVTYEDIYRSLHEFLQGRFTRIQNTNFYYYDHGVFYQIFSPVVFVEYRLAQIVSSIIIKPGTPRESDIFLQTDQVSFTEEDLNKYISLYGFHLLEITFKDIVTFQQDKHDIIAGNLFKPSVITMKNNFNEILKESSHFFRKSKYMRRLFGLQNITYKNEDGMPPNIQDELRNELGVTFGFTKYYEDENDRLVLSTQAQTVTLPGCPSPNPNPPQLPTRFALV